MAKAAYIGVLDISHNGKKIYFGDENSIARKIKKGYIGVNGVARLFLASEPSVSYSGDYTTTLLEVDGKQHTLFALTSSGVLTLNDSVDTWMCGGGAGGGLYGSYYKNAAGVGGAGGYVNSGKVPSGTYAVSIGTGGTSTTSTGYDGSATNITKNDGTFSMTANGATANASGTVAGGSGGGGAETVKHDNPNVSATLIVVAPSKGAGVSTYPFGLVELYAHSAGGGGGGSTSCLKPGDGGTNGGDGTARNAGTGTGGVRGGGNGTTSALGKGSSATFYGSGGGGGSAGHNATSSNPTSRYAGGSGYQGIVYLLIEGECLKFDIITQPTSVICAIGNDTAITLEAIGGGIVYQWQWRNPNMTTEWTNLVDTTSMTNSLILNEVSQDYDGYEYRCVLKNNRGETRISDIATLTVIEFRIVTQPVSQTVGIFQRATFTVEAIGDGITYQWQEYKNSTWSNLSGQTSSQLSITSSFNKRTFRCVLTHPAGMVLYTDEVTLQ